MLHSHGHILAMNTCGFFHPDASYLTAEAGRMATPSLFIRLTCFLSLQILRRLDCFILMTFTPRMACPLQCKEYTVQPRWALEISVPEKLRERLHGDPEAWWCKGEDSGIQGPSCHLPVGSSRQMTQSTRRMGHGRHHRHRPKDSQGTLQRLTQVVVARGRPVVSIQLLQKPPPPLSNGAPFYP